METRLWAGQPRNRSSILGSGKRVFSSAQGPDRFWGLPNLQQLYETLSQRVKRPEHEADHSSPFNA
jgi:hypothetical protein